MEDFFLKNQIITYLGNKRKLIPFINEVVEEIKNNDEILKLKKNCEISFFDIFAGSGIVSRYSKLKGFKTYSNDLELYSYIILKSTIGTNKEELNQIFKNVAERLKKPKDIKDNYQYVINYLNELNEPQNKKNLYFSINYAPKDTNKPDHEKERLFYTQENAKKIDAIQEKIQDKSIFDEKSREVILASLMYKMTTNINTSGTMKGCYNGFGGPKKNALDRILGKIKLEKLPLINKIKGVAFNDFAEQVFENNNLNEMDIVYADPPYNSHQYSANYNHLNTLALNDKYYPGEVIKGTRAGIRKDHNKSEFCYTSKHKDEKEYKKAEIAFINLIKNIKSKYIILSYNNEGIVEIDKLLDILSEKRKNKVSIKYKEHDKFKGGKNTQTSNKVIEYLIIIEKNKKQEKIELEKIKEKIKIGINKILFLDKYIDYETDLLIKEETIKNNKKYIILKDKENTFSITLNKETFKVTSENFKNITDKKLQLLKKLELTNLELMKKYIKNKNKVLAQKILKTLKIKKYEKEYLYYESKINDKNTF
jgi:adenine-specific DNA-methyltransferase